MGLLEKSLGLILQFRNSVMERTRIAFPTPFMSEWTRFRNRMRLKERCDIEEANFARANSEFITATGSRLTFDQSSRCEPGKKLSRNRLRNAARCRNFG